jgi:hypothetical protein
MMTGTVWKKLKGYKAMPDNYSFIADLKKIQTDEEYVRIRAKRNDFRNEFNKADYVRGLSLKEIIKHLDFFLDDFEKRNANAEKIWLQYAKNRTRA